MGGEGQHPGAHLYSETVHANHVPADAVIVPDAQLLFGAEFKRTGVDLVLSGDGRQFVVHDYFKGEKHAPLASADGAHLTGDIVTALAGQVQYAQASGAASAGQVIGHVTKLVGSATAIRNGVSIILNNGDNVEKGDVVQSGSELTVGITFIDGTVFGLSSNARMVLNEMVYDPNGSSNSSLLSLVAGTITFVAGETAKHGDMKIDTPVATMGIRGTAVLVEIDFSVPGATPDAKFQVLVEPDGTTGSYILFDKTTLTPLAVVDKAGMQINISNGLMSQTTTPLSPELQKLIQDVFSLKFTDSTNPKSLYNFTDTITPQTLSPIKLANGDSATPVVLFTATTPENSPPVLSPSGPNIPPVPHIGQPPSVVSESVSLTAHTASSRSSGVDSVSGTIRFADVNAADRPTAAVNFVSLKLLDAQHNDITATLSSQQIATIVAELVVTPNPANNNNGSATWTYSVANSSLNFLTAGETLTLTYNAIVNNNYSTFDQTTTVPFTITVTSTGPVEWIHQTGGLWSVGSNWSSGTAPTANDDAIIPAQNIPGGSGFYDVTIESAATARSLTLNANDTTGAEIINDSTLTVSDLLTVFTNGVFQNSGTGIVEVGQKFELLDEATLVNSGLITLGHGGDFKNSSEVSNFGKIEVAGGTLNVQVDVNNADGVIDVDGGASLTLSGATIDGGEINSAIGDDASIPGSIGVTGSSKIADATLNDGQVTISSGDTLTLDDDVVNSTTFTDTASGAAIQVDAGNILTLAGVAIEGGTINLLSNEEGDSNDGTINIAGSSTIDDASLNGGEVDIAVGQVLTLDDDTVNGVVVVGGSGSVIQIDDGATLTLTGGTVVTGCSINDGTTSDTDGQVPFGCIDVSGASTIGNSFLSNGEVSVEDGVTLTLNNVTVTATSFIDAGSAAASGGTIETVGAVTFQSGVLVDGGQMSIAKGSTLDIENSVTGTGATLTNVDVLNSGAIQVDEPGPGTTVISLVLDGGTTVTGGILLINSGFPIHGIEGMVEIGEGGATLDGVMVVNKNVLTVDDDATLNLNETTITGGTLSGGGTIATHSGVNVFENVTINSATVEVDNGSVLGLSGNITNDGLIELESSIDITQLEISGNVLLCGNGQVVLSDNAENMIVSDGSAAVLTNVNSISGSGTIGDAFLTIVNEGTIAATGTNPLVIDTGVNAISEHSHWPVGSLEVTNDSTGILEASAGHVLQIDDNVLNNGVIQAGDLGGGDLALINIAGDLNGSGSIDIFANGKIEIGGAVSSGQTVIFESSGGGELVLDDPQDFHGLIKVLAPAAPEATENYIDLKGFAYTTETKVSSVSFDESTGITAVTISDGGTAPNLTIHVVGDYYTGDIRFADDGEGGTLISDPTVNSAALIASGSTLEIGAASAATVVFGNDHGNTGELVLDSSRAFTGQIAGFSGDGSVSNSDLIDIADISFASIAIDKTTYVTQGDGSGVLTLYDANGYVLDNLKFDGSYQLSNFSIENDGSGHTLIVDPPENYSGAVADNKQSDQFDFKTNPVLPTPSKVQPTTFVDSLGHEGENFVFKSTDNSQPSSANFHSLPAELQFGISYAGNSVAVSTHNDTTFADLHGHDMWADAHNAQLHLHDFHIA